MIIFTLSLSFNFSGAPTLVRVTSEDSFGRGPPVLVVMGVSWVLQLAWTVVRLISITGWMVVVVMLPLLLRDSRQFQISLYNRQKSMHSFLRMNHIIKSLAITLISLLLCVYCANIKWKVDVIIYPDWISIVENTKLFIAIQNAPIKYVDMPIIINYNFFAGGRSWDVLKCKNVEHLGLLKQTWT